MARLGRGTRWTLRVLVALVLLVGLAWVFRGAILGPIVARRIVEELHDRLGGRYAVERVEGGFVKDLTIVGLRTIEPPPEGGPVVEVAAERVTVEYDAFAPIRSDLLSHVRSIRATGGAFEVDLGRFGTKEPYRPPAEPQKIPERLPRLEFRGRVKVITEGRSVEAPVLVVEGGGTRISLATGDLVTGRGRRVPGGVAATVERDAEGTWRWTSASFVEGIRIPEATYTEKGELEARVETPAGDVDFSASRSDVRIVAKDLDLQRLPTWVLDLVPPTWPSLDRGHLALEASANRWPEGDALFSVGASDLVVGGASWGTVRATGKRTPDGRIRVDALDVLGEDARVLAHDAVLDPDSPWIVSDAASFDARFPDLRRVLPGLDRWLRLVVRATRREGGDLRLESAELEGEGFRLMATGSLRPPITREGWKATELEAEVRGTVSNIGAVIKGVGGNATLTGRVGGTLERPTGRFELAGRDVALPWAVFEEAHATATLDGERLELERTEGRSGEANVTAAISVTLLPPTLRRVAYDATVPRASRLGPLLGVDLAPMAGRAHVVGEVVEPEGNDLGTAAVEIVDLAWDGVALGRLEAHIEHGTAAAGMQSILLDGPMGRLEGAGKFVEGTAAAVVERLNLRIAGLEASLAAPVAVAWDAGRATVPQLRVVVDGTTVEAALDVEPAQGRAVLRSLEARGHGTVARLVEPVELRAHGRIVETGPVRVVTDHDVEAAGRARVDVDSGDVALSGLSLRSGTWDASFPGTVVLRGEGDDLLLEDVRALVRGADVAASVRLSPRASRARLTHLRLRWRGLDTSLRAPVEVAWGGGVFRADGIDADLAGGRVTGNVAWDGAWHADLTADAVPLACLIADLRGRLDGRLAVEGASGSLDAVVTGFGVGGFRGSLEIAARQGATGGVHVTRARWVDPGCADVTADVRLPWRLEDGEMVRVEGAPSRLEANGAITNLGRLLGVGTGTVAVEAQGDETGLRVTLRGTAVGLAADLVHGGVVTVEATPEHVALRAATDAGPGSVLRGEARLDRGLDWTSPPAWADLFEHARVEGSLVADPVDLAIVRQLLLPGVRSLVGRARASLAFEGPLRAPHVTGSVGLEEGALHLEGAIPTISGLRGTARWEGDTLVLQSVEGRLGQQSFVMTGFVDRPFSGAPRFDLALKGSDLLVVRTSTLRLRADVDLTFQGPYASAVLAGRARIVDATVRGDSVLDASGSAAARPGFRLFSIRDAPFSTARLDLDVRAPAGSIRVRGGVADGEGGGHLVLRGTGERPEPEGRVDFEDVVVKLPFVRLDVATAQVEFPPGDPESPHIEATGRTRVRGYDLFVHASGEPPDLHLDVYTRPALPQEDAALLLATGSTREEMAATGGGELILGRAARFFGGSLTESGGDEGSSFFDRFHVESGPGESRTGRPILRSDFDADDRWTVRLERDRYDALNAGLVWRLRFR